MMQLDYSELHHTRNISGIEKSESVEDKRFRDILTANIHRNERGNWEMPLPFKTDDVTLPNNREQCLKRLLGIKQKLLKNGKTLVRPLHRIHAEDLRQEPPEELRTNAGKVWYLPHFDIITLRNQTKFE